MSRFVRLAILGATAGTLAAGLVCVVVIARSYWAIAGARAPVYVYQAGDGYMASGGGAVGTMSEGGFGGGGSSAGASGAGASSGGASSERASGGGGSDGGGSNGSSQAGRALETPLEQTYERPPESGPTIRVAVIGGMTFTGFWGELVKRYEQEQGVRVDLMATGEKNDIARAFKAGGVDVITMHACDTIINLVADGYAMEPAPWMKNDLVIVGPADDPAGIRGMADAASALRKISSTKSAFVVHSSLGSQEVLMNLLEPNQITLDPARTTVLFDDQQRSVLSAAAARHAYTLVGRIPFRTGKLPNAALEMMVEGDPRLRRPYIIAAANPARIAGARLEEARKFEKYVLGARTQGWIAEFGRGMIDDQPLFFPIWGGGAREGS